ncbi:hypothetical protein ACTOB_003618 [Actinoplanes oblitus]|uniref:Chorismate mutase domain-containing protein n=1 Tax=Actinoplanes oblitus TaxID=3040509 RepID=A0ABY8WS74_9ACTN|nr:hypothetical protein [Actinoplanes oblitus]WIM99948.1 hypothetical protein ACTOB_003618 [Actinoplanes oblitus]
MTTTCRRASPATGSSSPNSSGCAVDLADILALRAWCQQHQVRLRVLGGALTADDERREKMAAQMGYMPMDEAVGRLIERMRRDVLDAIERRMTMRDG